MTSKMQREIAWIEEAWHRKNGPNPDMEETYSVPVDRPKQNIDSLQEAERRFYEDFGRWSDGGDVS
jgi:hypothetical protein